MPTDISTLTAPTAAGASDAARNLLQNYCKQAKLAAGKELLDIIEQVLEAPGIYVFSELYLLPNVQELKNGPHAKHFNTLTLFAYGTYKEYRTKPEEYIELNAVKQKKLQQLTIMQLAIATKQIPYDVLQEELEIDNVRRLEDTIIDAIYADIIHGKLFQNHRYLEIDDVQGRDVPPGHRGKIIELLSEWSASCDSVIACIDEQVLTANIERANHLKNTERIEQEVTNIKKLIKTQLNNENDETMQVDSQTNVSTEVRKKSSKSKSSRPTGGQKPNK